MQIKKEQLQRQQKIMAHLGFYRHKCDGIWGPESISAKKRWEGDASFIPALPNNGLPFGDRDPLPKGMTHSRSERMFSYAGMDLSAPESKEEKVEQTEQKVEEKAEAEPSVSTEGSHNGISLSHESASSEEPKTQSAEAEEPKHEQRPSEQQHNPNGFKKKKKHQHR